MPCQAVVTGHPLCASHPVACGCAHHHTNGLFRLPYVKPKLKTPRNAMQHTQQSQRLFSTPLHTKRNETNSQHLQLDKNRVTNGCTMRSCREPTLSAKPFPRAGHPSQIDDTIALTSTRSQTIDSLITTLQKQNMERVENTELPFH